MDLTDMVMGGEAAEFISLELKVSSPRIKTLRTLSSTSTVVFVGDTHIPV
jgi:hypothetical protein